MGLWVGLTFGSLSLYLFSSFSYLWGVLKWNESRIEPTKKTMFRSWMVNFINFWISLAITVVNLVFAWAYQPPFPYSYELDYFVDFYTHAVDNLIGTFLIAAGIVMGWKMKNLWYIYDPTGALKDEEFDYFKWTDMEGDDSTRNTGYSADVFYQTPYPMLEDTKLTAQMTIPEEFSDFQNNVDIVSICLWYDGENSDIFSWATENSENNTDFGMPTGDIFAAEVQYLGIVWNDDRHYICFDHADFANVRCAATSGDFYFTLTTEAKSMPKDGLCDTSTIEYGVEENDGQYSSTGAGIGAEFGQNFSVDPYTWTVWHWNDDGEYNMPEGEYKVYYIQEESDGSAYCFSDAIEIVYNGA